MSIFGDFEPVVTADRRKVISINSNDVSTLAIFMAHYWEALFARPIFTEAPPRLAFTFAGQKWLSDMVTPLTSEGFLVTAYREVAGATGICFALERKNGAWEPVKHFRWLHGDPGKLTHFTPGEACRLFCELEIGRKLPR